MSERKKHPKVSVVIPVYKCRKICRRGYFVYNESNAKRTGNNSGK